MATYIPLLQQVVDCAAPIQGQKRLPTAVTTRVLERANLSTNFPRSFTLGDGITSVLEDQLSKLDQALVDPNLTREAFLHLINTVTNLSNQYQGQNLGMKELSNMHGDVYITPLNTFLRTRHLGDVLKFGDDHPEPRSWVKGGIQFLTNQWVLRHTTKKGQEQPLACVWEQSVLTVPLATFDNIRRAIGLDLVSMDARGHVKVVNHYSLVGDERRIERILEVMWTKLATLQIRLGLLTTHERSLLFFMNNGRVEVSRVFSKNEGAVTGTLDGVLPLFVALSTLTPLHYLVEAGGPVRALAD
ncbi:hypothetical protein M231_05508 [Tremella mesenterica]|uniref:Fungal-type protein kinase domain-containing protein n=1 Tax=Tremella mesenterica TaxID=5217 RepID=A0A4Q1BHW1_TREME|nr:hypothetical protein M231_05508 [Tremella mesenterica]